MMSTLHYLDRDRSNRFPGKIRFIYGIRFRIVVSGHKFSQASFRLFYHRAAAFRYGLIDYLAGSFLFLKSTRGDSQTFRDFRISASRGGPAAYVVETCLRGRDRVRSSYRRVVHSIKYRTARRGSGERMLGDYGHFPAHDGHEFPHLHPIRSQDRAQLLHVVPAVELAERIRHVRIQEMPVRVQSHRYGLVAHQLLHHLHVHPGPDEVRGERMTETVVVDLADGNQAGGTERASQHGQVAVVVFRHSVPEYLSRRSRLEKAFKAVAERHACKTVHLPHDGDLSILDVLPSERDGLLVTEPRPSHERPQERVTLIRRLRYDLLTLFDSPESLRLFDDFGTFDPLKRITTVIVRKRSPEFPEQMRHLDDFACAFSRISRQGVHEIDHRRLRYPVEGRLLRRLQKFHEPLHPGLIRHEGPAGPFCHFHGHEPFPHGDVHRDAHGGISARFRDGVPVAFLEPCLRLGLRGCLERHISDFAVGMDASVPHRIPGGDISPRNGICWFHRIHSNNLSQV